MRVLLFLAFVIEIDYAFGQFFTFLRVHARGGSTANCEYIANRSEDDIIILGSSRATHHYVPQIIEDSLALSCYNCGEEGNGVVLAYGRLKMLTDRYKPKLVLFEVTPVYDYGDKELNNKYLGYLRAYYYKEGIRGIFNDFDGKFSRIKMSSKMYQNTSRLLPDLVDNVIYRDNHLGFEPLHGQMTKENFGMLKEGQIAIDSLKLSYLEKLIVLCKGKDIPLLFMVSPVFHGVDLMGDYEPALELCEQYGIEIGNYKDDSFISNRVEFFQDAEHLNQAGAIVYTQRIIPLIKRSIQQ